MNTRLYRLTTMALVLLLAGGSLAFTTARAQDDASSATGGTLPLFGMIEGEDAETGFFHGTVSDLVASEQDGEIVLDGLVDGLVIFEDETIRVTGQEFSSVTEPRVGGSIDAEDYDSGDDGEEATPEESGQIGETLAFASLQTANDEGKCDVLFLNIQPITLNLLGLEVLTSPITIDVNAIPGEGNLLGNLVCSLAGLLDGTPDAVGEITDQLNQVLSGANVAPVDAGTPDAEAGDDLATEEATEEAPEDTDGEATEEPTEESDDEEVPDEAEGTPAG